MEMDEFDKKHELIQDLMNMLKSSAVKEVETGLHPADSTLEMPDKAKGMEIEKVAVIPGDKDEDVSLSPEAASLPELDDKDDMEDEPEEEEIPAFSALMKRKMKK